MVPITNGPPGTKTFSRGKQNGKTRTDFKVKSAPGRVGQKTRTDFKVKSAPGRVEPPWDKGNNIKLHKAFALRGNGVWHNPRPNKRSYHSFGICAVHVNTGSSQQVNKVPPLRASFATEFYLTPREFGLDGFGFEL